MLPTTADSGKLSCGKLLGRQIDHNLDVGVREIAGRSVQAALEPVLVNSTDEVDNVALLEAQLSLVLRLKVIQSLAAWLPSTYSHPQMQNKINATTNIYFIATFIDCGKLAQLLRKNCAKMSIC